MLTPVNPRPHTAVADSPYCSDPNCLSCKELREMHEKVRTGKPIPAPTRRSA